MGIDIKGVARRFQKVGMGTERELRLTGMESLAVANVEPLYSELARSGRRFAGGCQVIANGIAPVSAIPTTTATLALYNSASDGGASICVDRVGFCLGSGTAAAGATLWLAVSNGKPTAPSAASNYSSTPLGLSGASSSVARWATALTIPSGSAWFQALSTFQLAAANVGQGDAGATLQGVLIPPGYALGIAILSGAGTTPLYSVSAMWAEVELDLES